jgi:ketosteroid isomerase-like protein
MFKLKQAALLAAGVAVLAGCMQKPQDSAPIEAMIRTHTNGWVEAYNAGDADKIVAGYTDDAVLMPPDAPAAVGHDAMKQFLVTDMAAAKTSGTTLALDSDTIGVSGDLAWHSGTFHVNGSAGSSIATGKYLEVWHKDDKGNWLMIRDIWNADAPAVAPAPPPPPPKAEAPKKKKKTKKK